jgi:hypothetical protein
MQRKPEYKKLSIINPNAMGNGKREGTDGSTGSLTEIGAGAAPQGANAQHPAVISGDNDVDVTTNEPISSYSSPAATSPTTLLDGAQGDENAGSVLTDEDAVEDVGASPQAAGEVSATETTSASALDESAETAMKEFLYKLV